MTVHDTLNDAFLALDRARTLSRDTRPDPTGRGEYIAHTIAELCGEVEQLAAMLAKRCEELAS